MVLFTRRSKYNYDQLSYILMVIHNKLFEQSAKCINQSVIIRNWLLGLVVNDYKNFGLDRDKYSDSLYPQISNALIKNKIPDVSVDQIIQYRQFYRAYPHLVDAIPSEWDNFSISNAFCLQDYRKYQTSYTHVPAVYLINHLTYSHFVKLLECKDLLKRSYYECQCISKKWVPEKLHCQINALSYESSKSFNNEEKIVSLISSICKKAEHKRYDYDPKILSVFELLSKTHMLTSSHIVLFLKQFRTFIFENYNISLPEDKHIERFVRDQLFNVTVE